MNLTTLTAISPIDGRYRSKTSELSAYFSEAGLMKYRVWIEIEYFIRLSSVLNETIQLSTETIEKLRSIYESFTEKNAESIKEIEKITNHDVKAVEYFIKNQFDNLGLSSVKEYVHFGLTSQDINNTAIPLSLRLCSHEVIFPEIERVIERIVRLAEQWKEVPMLARTHGQPASPTRLGKEFMVFAERLDNQMEQLINIPFSAKFGGATGNFNAHHVCFPNIDWIDFAEKFIEDLGLERSMYTTQIEHYDNLSAYFDNLKRICTILIDLCRDVWQYISMGYFTQKIKAGEIGSSAMPHKVNPIDFENAEGNLGISIALFEHLSAKLPISRLQRDLTDSTVLRNLGVPLAHVLISTRSLLNGLDKLQLNEPALQHDLEENWAVVAEAIQTILRREAYPEPYEALKTLTRGKHKITKEVIHQFINELKVSNNVKKELLAIEPLNYTGILF